ncbi:DNA primase family protein [Lactobacillus johnsonii]|uniref:DNA primase family protein n=1 Tax=Lactobacillus johnsonii TaxID=33959 RepID=UPI0017873CEF|nr:DNA primase family protein [Lactobacillus johnsonii]QXL47425.1 hypothetical protein IGB12_08725 [Lactobacillus johnsonii]
MAEKENTIKKDTWLYFEDNQGKHFKAFNFADYLMDRFHFTFTFFDPHGFWWNPITQQWKGKADTRLKAAIIETMDKVAGRSYKGNTVSNVQQIIKDYRGRDESETDRFAIENRNPHKVVFANGTYDLDQDVIEPNRYDNYILQNHDYVLGELPSTPTSWDRWLTESLVDPDAKKDDAGKWETEGDKNAPETFKAFIGYALAGTYQEIQSYLIIHGNGGEGKSTALNIIALIFGANISHVDLADLGSKDTARFKLSKLNRMELNIGDDIEGSFLKTTSILKRLTGGNPVSAEDKGQDPYDFTNNAKLLFTCNALPSFSDNSHGMERRPIVLEWRKIKNFSKKYSKAEFIRDRPAFVRECLVAYAKALRKSQLLNEPQLPMTEYMKQRVKEWLMTNDTIGNWINENCELGENYREQTQTLYNNYTRYCHLSGTQALKKAKFNGAMRTRGIEPNKTIKINGKTTKGYKGIHRIEKYDSDLY